MNSSPPRQLLQTASYEHDQLQATWQRQEWPPPSEFFRQLCDRTTPTPEDKEIVQWLATQPEYTCDFQRYAAEVSFSTARWASLEIKLCQWHKAHGPSTGFAPKEVIVNKAKTIFVNLREYRGRSVPKFCASWLTGFKMRYFHYLVWPRRDWNSPPRAVSGQYRIRTMEHEQGHDCEGRSISDTPMPPASLRVAGIALCANDSQTMDISTNTTNACSSANVLCDGSGQSEDVTSNGESACVLFVDNAAAVSISEHPSPCQTTCSTPFSDTDTNSDQTPDTNFDDTDDVCANTREGPNGDGNDYDANDAGMECNSPTNDIGNTEPPSDKVTQALVSPRAGIPANRSITSIPYCNLSRGIGSNITTDNDHRETCRFNSSAQQNSYSEPANVNGDVSEDIPSWNETQQGDFQNVTRTESHSMRYTTTQNDNVLSNDILIDPTRFYGRVTSNGISNNLLIHNRRNADIDFGINVASPSMGEPLQVNEGCSGSPGTVDGVDQPNVVTKSSYMSAQSAQNQFVPSFNPSPDKITTDKCLLLPKQLDQHENSRKRVQSYSGVVKSTAETDSDGHRLMPGHIRYLLDCNDPSQTVVSNKRRKLSVSGAADANNECVGLEISLDQEHHQIDECITANEVIDIDSCSEDEEDAALLLPTIHWRGNPIVSPEKPAVVPAQIESAGLGLIQPAKELTWPSSVPFPIKNESIDTLPLPEKTVSLTPCQRRNNVASGQFSPNSPLSLDKDALNCIVAMNCPAGIDPSPIETTHGDTIELGLVCDGKMEGELSSDGEDPYKTAEETFDLPTTHDSEQTGLLTKPNAHGCEKPATDRGRFVAPGGDNTRLTLSRPESVCEAANTAHKVSPAEYDIIARHVAELISQATEDDFERRARRKATRKSSKDLRRAQRLSTCA